MGVKTLSNHPLEHQPDVAALEYQEHPADAGGDGEALRYAFS